MKRIRSDLFFSPEEYQARWARVHQAMAARGYEHLLIWQRGAGTFDRVGDVWWLTNFVMNCSGQTWIYRAWSAARSSLIRII
jgi:Xaa-Pro dipeptidase